LANETHFGCTVILAISEYAEQFPSNY